LCLGGEKESVKESIKEVALHFQFFFATFAFLRFKISVDLDVGE